MSKKKKELKFPTAWQAPLTKESWFGAGVGNASTYYNKVSVVGYWQGVTLAFNRSDNTDHLTIYLEPEDAKAIGEQLIKKSADVTNVQVLYRLKGGEF